MAADYPSSAYTANPQDTSNDPGGDATDALGSDFNGHDEEIVAVTADLVDALAVQGVASMEALAKKLQPAHAGLFNTGSVTQAVTGTYVVLTTWTGISQESGVSTLKATGGSGTLTVGTDAAGDVLHVSGVLCYKLQTAARDVQLAIFCNGAKVSPDFIGGSDTNTEPESLPFSFPVVCAAGQDIDLRIRHATTDHTIDVNAITFQAHRV